MFLHYYLISIVVPIVVIVYLWQELGIILFINILHRKRPDRLFCYLNFETRLAKTIVKPEADEKRVCFCFAFDEELNTRYRKFCRFLPTSCLKISHHT